MARGDFSLERYHSRQTVFYFRILLPILLLVSLTASQNFVLLQGAAAAPAGYQIYTVNSTIDAPDADTGDGICATADGVCTLRAAIMQANSDITPVMIILPAGLYHLTRVGYDDNGFAGDLDISSSLVILGSGSGVTIIDGNGAVTGDRVFQLLSGSQVSMVNLTIRNGDVQGGTYNDGGGILIQGASLFLNNLLIEGNTASNGGGLAADSGQIQLEHTVIRSNTAASSGGGFYANASGMTIQDSKVYSNTASSGGGLALSGIENGRIERTEIYSNTASFWGGGLDNEASLSDPIQKVMLEDSSLHNNYAVTDGGAIISSSSLVISHTVLEANSAGSKGGGLYFFPGAAPRTTLISSSTLSHNTAQYGGGAYVDVLSYFETSQTTLNNTTFSGNSVSHDGGGIYATHDAHISLLNTTIANNQLHRDVSQHYAVHGGGLVITATAIITAQNTLIGNNTFASGITLPTPNDCFGKLHSLGNNLIQDIANCSISGTTFGNVTGQYPLLGPLQNNGGSIPTQALLAGSPAIDAGTNNACPSTDQRGVARPFDGDGNGSAICDMGAYEAASHRSQSISFAPINPKTLLDSPFVIIATASSGLGVDFGTTTANNCSVSGSSLFAGVSSTTVTLSKTGNCTLVAQQPGDPTFDPATPVTQTFTVRPNLFLPLSLDQK